MQSIGTVLLLHDGLADVDDFRRLVTETMDAEDLQRVEMEDDLQHAYFVAGDLRAGNVAEKGFADFVWNFFLGQFGLVEPYRADFGNRVDAGRNILQRRECRCVEDRIGGSPSLVVAALARAGRPITSPAA